MTAKKSEKKGSLPEPNVCDCPETGEKSSGKSSSDNRAIILNCEMMERRMVLLNNNRLEEYQVERDDDTPKTGNIYLGKIINLDPLLQAAFVDIGAAKNAFLHYSDMLQGYPELAEKYRSEHPESEAQEGGKKKKKKAAKTAAQAENIRIAKGITAADIPNIFKPGMMVLVQVVKSPISTKGARITTDITIPGRYLVLMPYHNNRNLSSRIESTAERERLKKVISELELPQEMGLICRTVGEGRKSTFFKRDLKLLLDYWHGIEKERPKHNTPKLLFTEPNLVDRTLRDFLTEDIGQIVVDDPQARDHIISTMKRIGAAKMARKVSLYKGSLPIFDFYKINQQLKDVFQREVKLPSGGAIVIDETEALIAIDVNTGHSKNSAADQPEFILKTNLEAAEEIYRQLRLRNIGGLVVIDFIDMKSPQHREEVFKTMRKLVKSDRARTKVLPLSNFGLMEMTRQREQESIKDQIFNFCPYCGGSGLVKSAVTMSAEIQRKLNSVLKNKSNKNVPVRVFMHPDILARLRNSDAKLLEDIEKRHTNDLSFRADPALHYEEFRIVDAVTGSELQ